MSMKRIALVAALALSLAGAGGASAAHFPCALPDSHPLWVEFADTSVGFRFELFGRPGLVLASSGVTGPAELRARGAQTVFWWMKLQRYVGTPSRPADPATVQAGAEDLYARAVLSSGCDEPVIALNELWGAHQRTPWLYENYLYRQNVLSLLRALSAKGAVPFLLVVGPHSGNRAPFVDGDARVWWLEAAKHAHIVRQMHFNAPYIRDMGPIVGARTRRIAMRAAVKRFTDIGIPADRIALVLGFQSGPGKGGREGLRPTHAWLEIVKQDALAARQVAGELGVGSIWSWGWGTFDEAGADPDKPKAACVYLWARDPALCDGPAVAGPRFNASLTLGQIQLAPGRQCTTNLGPIESAEFEQLAQAFGNRQAALTALLNRLVYLDENVDPSPADLAHAERAVITRGFGGDSAAYESALVQLGLSAASARRLIADQLRRQAFEAIVRIRYLADSPRAFAELRQRRALRSTICLADELPGSGVADIPSRVPVLAIREGSISISAHRYRVKRGARVTLSGSVDSERASELVTIYARPVGSRSYTRLGTLRAPTGGGWRFQVRPVVRTAYRAVSKSAASNAILVDVTR
jgi:hypothetical protein